MISYTWRALLDSEVYGKNLADAAWKLERENINNFHPPSAIHSKKIVEDCNQLGVDGKTQIRLGLYSGKWDDLARARFFCFIATPDRVAILCR